MARKHQTAEFCIWLIKHLNLKLLTPNSIQEKIMLTLQKKLIEIYKERHIHTTVTIHVLFISFTVLSEMDIMKDWQYNYCI